MDALEEAYREIFGDLPPSHLSRKELVERAIEGLSVELHGSILIRRCKDAIANDPLIPVETRDWAKHTFTECLRLAKKGVQNGKER